MDKQKLFNEASYAYLECQRQIKELNLYKPSKNYNSDDLLKDFDILIQVLLLYAANLDHEIYDIELKFINLLTVEEDILLPFNKSWNEVSKIAEDSKLFMDFVDSIYKEYYARIQSFIMFLAANDAITEEDFSKCFIKELKTILESFTLIKDCNTNIDKIIENSFTKIYRELKSVYGLVNNL